VPICITIAYGVSAWRGGGQILAFSIDLLRRPYNTLALPCECVIMQISACNYVSLFSRFRDISKISVLPSCYPPKSRLKLSQGVFYYTTHGTQFGGQKLESLGETT